MVICKLLTILKHNINNIKLWYIWGSHSSDYEEYSLPRCDSFRTIVFIDFQRNILHPYPDWRHAAQTTREQRNSDKHNVAYRIVTKQWLFKQQQLLGNDRNIYK
jgi:hypothetical protein